MILSDFALRFVVERGKKRNTIRELFPLWCPLQVVQTAKNGAKYGDKRLRKHRKYHENLGKVQDEITAVEFKSLCPCQNREFVAKCNEFPIFFYLKVGFSDFSCAQKPF